MLLAWSSLSDYNHPSYWPSTIESPLYSILFPQSNVGRHWPSLMRPCVRVNIRTYLLSSSFTRSAQYVLLVLLE